MLLKSIYEYFFWLKPVHVKETLQVCFRSIFVPMSMFSYNYHELFLNVDVLGQSN